MTNTLYPKESKYSYIDKFEDTPISKEGESFFAWEAYQADKLQGKVDEELIPFLDKLFANTPRLLIPIFSCAGHEDNFTHEQGYVIFRSLLSCEDTIEKIFKPLLLKYTCEGTDLRIHVWPTGAIGYVLYFSRDNLGKVLRSLTRVLKNVYIES
jgi:hypothetical protein